MTDFRLMLYIFFLDNPADKSSVGKQNKGYDNRYRNNDKNQQIDI